MSAFALGLANGAAARRGFAAASRRSASPLFRTIQARPKDQRSCADRLLMRQTACAWRFLPAMIGGGTWEGAHARHEAAGVHHPARRCGGGVAARGARAAEGNLPTIGFLGASTPSAWVQWTAAFLQRLRQLGWTEGRTVAIEYRWAEGHSERYADIAAEFVRLNVDVIVTVGSAVPAAKQVTSTIPIVFAIAVDPLGSGMVASLARPGGNATGISVQSTELAGKRLEILREALPDLNRLAIIGDVNYSGSVLEISQVQAAARKFGIDIAVLEIRRAADIAPAFQALKSGAQALYVCPGALVNANYARINTFAMGARLPAFHAGRDFLGGGGFMSYGSNYADQFRHAADFVDKILKGTKPADLPVEQPTKFELVINLTTVKALGLAIPETSCCAPTR